MVRKAESKSDDVIVRCFIPSNCCARFMYLNKVCTEQRAADPSLKTQLRFGRSDIEIYVKYKGQPKVYMQVTVE